MKSKTRIKSYHPGRIKSLVKIIGVIVISLLLGFVIAYFGKDLSYIEESFITVSLTLFGFNLTSVVFICGAIQNIKVTDNAQISVLLKEIAESLGTILCAILVAIGLDFLVSIIVCPDFLNMVLRTVKYGALLFSLFSQLDVIKAFLKIVKSMYKKEENQN